MSCIIDRVLRFRRGTQGSILMEFMIVLPIYFMLFGYVFLVGDLGLKTISLAIGDRDAAMDAGDRLEYSYSLFASNQIVGVGLQAAQSMTLRADEDFRGAWSWQAAGLSKFTYQLPNWMSGFIIYPYRLFGCEDADDALVALALEKSVELRSKDFSDKRSYDVDHPILEYNARTYNYYTLKRTNLSREAESYRNWNPNQLVEMGDGNKRYWVSGVFEEPYADSHAQRLESEGSSQGSDKLPSPPSGLSKYERYDQFVTWSK